jgi:hypothetical protein
MIGQTVKIAPYKNFASITYTGEIINRFGTTENNEPVWIVVVPNPFKSFLVPNNEILEVIK